MGFWTANTIPIPYGVLDYCSHCPTNSIWGSGLLLMLPHQFHMGFWTIAHVAPPIPYGVPDYCSCCPTLRLALHIMQSYINNVHIKYSYLCLLLYTVHGPGM